MAPVVAPLRRSEEHTSELQSHGTISYAVFCLKKKKVLIGLYRITPSGMKMTSSGIVIAAKSNAAIKSLPPSSFLSVFIFFFNDTATTEIYTVPYTLSLHDALPITRRPRPSSRPPPPRRRPWPSLRSEEHTSELQSHGTISYAVFCLKKKKKKK